MKKVWNALQKENSIFVCDFDGTLTLSGSSMHGIVHVLGNDHPFSCDRDRLFLKYGRSLSTQESAVIEADKDLCWWREQMDLFIKYQIEEALFYQVAKILPVRMEAVELLKECQKAKIPIWIMSAGIGNVIESWLNQQNLSLDGITVLANYVICTDGIATGYTRHILPSGKAERFLEEAKPESDQHLVFFGDRQDDLDWRKENRTNFLIDRVAGIVQTV